LADFAIWQYATLALCTKDNFRLRFVSRVKGVKLCML
jgi:hypothetical protein